MKKSIFMAGMLAAALSAAGCSPTVIQLNEKDKGRTITCDKGDIIEIRLPGNPTTGYEWTPSRMPADTVLVKMSDEFVLTENGRKMVGVPGTYLFRYKVTGTGSEGISLQYSRSWENVKPISVYQVVIKAE